MNDGASGGDPYWVNKAQTFEAKYNTLKESVDGLKERVQQFKASFGVRERSDGVIDIDFEKMVERLGVEASLELRQVIDEIYNIRGAPGEKPKIKVKAA